MLKEVLRLKGQISTLWTSALKHRKRGDFIKAAACAKFAAIDLTYLCTIFDGLSDDTSSVKLALLCYDLEKATSKARDEALHWFNVWTDLAKVTKYDR